MGERRKMMLVPTTLITEVRGLARYNPGILALVVGTEIVGMSIGIVAIVLNFQPSLTVRTELIVILVSNIVAFALLYHILDDDALNAVLLFKSPTITSLLGVIGGVVGIITITSLVKTPSFQSQSLTSSIAGAPASFQFQMFLFLVIIFPLIEEVFFRGLLFGYTLDYTGSLAAAFLTTILLFGLVHIEYGIVGVIARLFASSIYVIQRIKFNSITESCLTHSLYNTVVFLGLIGLI